MRQIKLGRRFRLLLIATILLGVILFSNERYTIHAAVVPTALPAQALVSMYGDNLAFADNPATAIVRCVFPCAASVSFTVPGNFGMPGASVWGNRIAFAVVYPGAPGTELAYCDIPATCVTGAVVLTGVNPTADAGVIGLADFGARGFPSIYGDLIAYWAGLPPVISYYNVLTGVAVATGAVGTWPAIVGDRIVFSTPESSVGIDLNGDGDMTDHVIRYYVISTGTLVNTGAEGDLPSATNNRIAFETTESQVGPGGTDLNGDGDTADVVVRYYDMGIKSVVNTGQVGNSVSIYGDRIVFHVSESAAGVDYTGNGVTTDQAVRYYNINAPAFASSVIAIGVSPVGCDPVINGSRVAFLTNCQGAGKLSFISRVPMKGDANWDGKVDIVDLVTSAACFGSSITGAVC